MSPKSLLGFALAALLAACSSGSGTATASGAAQPTTAGGAVTQASTGGGQAAAGTPPDPCSLLTQAQVAAVVGVAVGAGSSADDPHACSWTFHDADAVSLVQATITTNINPSTFAKLCGAPSSSTLGISVVPVTGVGDTACYTETTGFGDILNFQKNGLGFTASVEALGSLQAKYPGGTTEPEEKTLALDALQHI